MNTNDKMNPADAKPMHISKPVIEASQIKANTKVMCSENGQLGVVEAMDGKNSGEAQAGRQGRLALFFPARETSDTGA